MQRQLNFEGTLADNYGWYPEQGTEVVLIPLDNPLEMLRFRVPAFWLWHFSNAYEDESGNLVVDYNQYDDYRRDVKSFLLSVHSGRYPASVGPSKFVRATIDLAAAAEWAKSPAAMKEQAGEDVYAVETLWDVSTEFARIAPSVETKDYQFAYMAAHSSPYAARRCLWDELAKVDVKAKTAETLSLGQERTPSEPIFVSREGSTAEDDGYILCLTYDGDSDKSFVAILDAQKLSEGTVAEIWLPQHVPVTFHRIWVAPEDWPTGTRPPAPPGR